MGWCNYLVVPELKALYDVYHAPTEKEFYAQIWDDLSNLEIIIDENSEIVQESKDKSLKNFPVRALNSMYKIFDAIPSVSDQNSRINIFIAFMMKFHKDAYILYEEDQKLKTLKGQGYKMFSYGGLDD